MYVIPQECYAFLTTQILYVNIVRAIISAFTTAVDLIRKRKVKKEAKQVASKESLAIGPPRVQEEFNSNFAKLWPRFAHIRAAMHRYEQVVQNACAGVNFIQKITTRHVSNTARRVHENADSTFPDQKLKLPTLMNLELHI